MAKLSPMLTRSGSGPGTVELPPPGVRIIH